MLTLFVAKNTVAVAAQIALVETGLSHQITWIDFAKGQQRAPDYLAVNPKGRVPALVTDHGTLTETPALLDYIAEISKSLMPVDPFVRARVREMIGYLSATMHVNHAHKMRGSRWSDDPAAQASIAAKVQQTMTASSRIVESMLPDKGWLVGPYSIADIHLYAVSRWLHGDGVAISEFPKLSAHFAAMQVRPAVIEVEASHA